MIVVPVNGSPVRFDATGPDAAARRHREPLSWSGTLLAAADAPDDGERAERARAHEAAADALAARGDWERAYHHLRAAVSLSASARTTPPGPPEQLHNEVDRLRRERAEAREQSRRDALTASYNRRYLDERLATLRGVGGGPGCLALADVDHFKQINDTYGHGLGDEVLRRLVAAMSSGLPPGGFCARYGGEEFALVLPDLDPTAAVALCEDVRARVDGLDWDDLQPGLRVTVSLGVACIPGARPGVVRATDPTPAPDPARDRPPSALDAADALLYVAKRAGRNAVAFRDDAGAVRLAGPAAARRGLLSASRVLARRADAPRSGRPA